MCDIIKTVLFTIKYRVTWSVRGVRWCEQASGRFKCFFSRFLFFFFWLTLDVFITSSCCFCWFLSSRAFLSRVFRAYVTYSQGHRHYTKINKTLLYATRRKTKIEWKWWSKIFKILLRKLRAATEIYVAFYLTSCVCARHIKNHHRVWSVSVNKKKKK